MKRNVIYCLSCIILLVSGCTDRQLNETNLVDTEHTEVLTTPTKLSSIVEVDRIVPLETKDESLIGKVEKLLKTTHSYLIRTTGQRILCFDENGKYRCNIGKLGTGPEEYPALYDFDADNDYVYILTTKRILVFDYSNRFIKEISVSLNSSALKAVKDGFLIYALGEEYVYYLLDDAGKIAQHAMERSQALRLTRNIPFTRFGNLYLSMLGHSNDIMVYDPSIRKFHTTRLTDIPDALSLEKENELKMKKGMKESRLKPEGTLFDGLTSTERQLLFGTMQGNDIVLWIKTADEEKGISFSAIEDDIAFQPVQYWLTENAISSDCFLSCFSPANISESLKEHTTSSSDEKYYHSLTHLLDTIDIEEGNPVIFEYHIK